MDESTEVKQKEIGGIDVKTDEKNCESKKVDAMEWDTFSGSIAGVPFALQCSQDKLSMSISFYTTFSRDENLVIEGVEMESCPLKRIFMFQKKRFLKTGITFVMDPPREVNGATLVNIYSDARAFENGYYQRYREAFFSMSYNFLWDVLTYISQKKRGDIDVQELANRAWRRANPVQPKRKKKKSQKAVF